MTFLTAKGYVHHAIPYVYMDPNNTLFCTEYVMVWYKVNLWL